MAEAEQHEQPEVVNGVVVDDRVLKPKRTHTHRNETLYAVLHRFLSMIFFPDLNTSAASTPLLQRIKVSVAENGPHLRGAAENTGRDVIDWTRRGSYLRALFVISAGSVTLLTLTGFLVFVLFFLAATFNAVVISLLMSLAAVGGFLAIFFACVTAIYVGALTVAVIAISTATVSAIVAVVIATGWIGFFWTIWLATKKSVGLAKHSLSATGSALSAYSSSRHQNHNHHD